MPPWDTSMVAWGVVNKVTTCLSRGKCGISLWSFVGLVFHCVYNPAFGKIVFSEKFSSQVPLKSLSHHCLGSDSACKIRVKSESSPSAKMPIVVRFQTSSLSTFWDIILFLLNFKRNFHVEENFFLQCSWYFSWIWLYVFYIVVKFQAPRFNTFWDMNFFLVTDRQKAMHKSASLSTSLDSCA